MKSPEELAIVVDENVNCSRHSIFPSGGKSILVQQKGNNKIAGNNSNFLALNKPNLAPHGFKPVNMVSLK